ncbi:tyrosine-type recombinase/integrase [Turicibacter sanguinis]|uniref:tyrosine-type recombinase/integrase n=1 Tax=Turicibacter sanguinis TaxID=154288 RepID=UPI0018A0B9A6|nr:site-specific integrase [Turicibacter sanguinis]
MNILPLVPEIKNNKNEEIMIGNSHFSDDIWDLTPLMPSKNQRKCQKFINFNYIQNKHMQSVVKQYAFERLGQVKPRTVHDEIHSRLPIFFKFCQANQIESFNDIDMSTYLSFVEWIRTEKNCTTRTGHAITVVVEKILKMGQIKGWSVNKTISFNEVSAASLWDVSKAVRQTKATPPIPEKILNQIVYNAIHNEKDILTKAAVIIQSQTGLRISEVVSIKEGCIHTNDNGDIYLEVTLSKTVKGGTKLHKVFVNELVRDVVNELSENTKELRKLNGISDLFIFKKANGSCGYIDASQYSGRRLKSFIKRWDIRDENGELYPLKSHQFRATFVRELIKKGVPLGHIQKHYGHVSMEMTDHYLTLKQDEIQKIYTDMLLNPKSKTAGLRSKEIKNKLTEHFRGKTESEIELAISDLANSMTFSPLPTGVCLHDTRRGNCSDGDGCFFYNCPNFITDTRFLSVHKKELELMEKEMKRFKEEDRERDWQRLYVKHKFLKPLVEELEAQLDD